MNDGNSGYLGFQ